MYYIEFTFSKILYSCKKKIQHVHVVVVIPLAFKAPSHKNVYGLKSPLNKKLNKPPDVVVVVVAVTENNEICLLGLQIH